MKVAFQRSASPGCHSVSSSGAFGYSQNDASSKSKLQRIVIASVPMPSSAPNRPRPVLGACGSFSNVRPW
jgi:hypothetical protein